MQIAKKNPGTFNKSSGRLRVFKLSILNNEGKEL
jgi:hypothetical protein